MKTLNDYTDYYKGQLANVNVGVTEYSPTIKVFANGNGDDTKHLDLNKDSANVLIDWLNDNFQTDQRMKKEIGEIVTANRIQELERSNAEQLKSLNEIKLLLDDEFQFKDGFAPENIVSCYEEIQKFIPLTNED